MYATYRSRYSVLILAFFMWGALSAPEPDAYLVGLVFFLFIVFLISGTRYIITDDKLISKLWFITFSQTNISDILKIERSYNPISTNAASLKRLEITVRSTRVSRYFPLISPAHEEQFLAQLKKINPKIIIDVNDKKSILRFWDWDI